MFGKMLCKKKLGIIGRIIYRRIWSSDRKNLSYLVLFKPIMNMFLCKNIALNLLLAYEKLGMVYSMDEHTY
jgi:hypothetical protein